MNNINPKILPIFNSVFSVAKRTAKNLQLSKTRLSAHLPLTSVDLNDEELLDKLDAFRARFTDLQDILGRKVFGSRLDNNKRGGDIDLLLQTDKINDELTDIAKLKYQLYKTIGEQKIDIQLLATPPSEFQQLVLETAELLLESTTRP